MKSYNQIRSTPCNYFLMLFFVLLITNCQTTIQKEYTAVSPNQLPTDALSPNEAIYKFGNLNEQMISEAVISSLQKIDLRLEPDEADKIKTWVADTVFSRYASNSQILEWRIMDDDFCQVKVKTIRTFEGELDFWECDSMIKGHASAGSKWVHNQDNFRSISIVMHSWFLDDFEPVDSYFIREGQEKLKVSDWMTQLNKFQVQTDVYLVFNDPQADFEYVEKLGSDKALMYTFLHEDIASASPYLAKN